MLWWTDLLEELGNISRLPIIERVDVDLHRNQYLASYPGETIPAHCSR